MSNWGQNIYYNPEKLDLEIFGTLEADLSYEFDILLVVKDKESGKLFYATDSGCSCPTPFEDFYYHMDGETNLEPLNKNTFEDFKNEVKNHHNYEWGGGGGITNSQRRYLVDKVKKYLNQKESND